MKISLAPMEGVVDPVIRELYSKLGGYDHMVTEFVRISARVLPAHVFYKYCPELRTGGKTIYGTPVYVQLLGGQPELLAESAAFVESLGALGIDMNFGCPARTVNNHDGGATLLKKPQRLYDVLTAIIKRVKIPVTAKVRLGFDHKDYVNDIAQAVDSAGAKTLTIHARTKVEGYKPPAHWEYIAKMRQAVKNTSVIANGDIWTTGDFAKCKEITGCQDFALGRPAIATPDLALQIKAVEAGNQYIAQPWEQVRTELFLPFVKMCLKFKDEKYAIARTKQWLKLLGKNYSQATIEFENIKRLKSLSKFPTEYRQPDERD